MLAGGELNLYDYLRSSPKQSSVVLLEDGPFRPLLEELGIPVSILPLSVVGNVRRGAGVRTIAGVLPAALGLCRQMRQIATHFDVLYANSQKAFLLAAFSKRTGQPLVWHLHDMLVPEHFSFLLRKMAVMAGNLFASVVIVNSKATADAYVAAGGKAEKVRLIYCGLDPALFDNVQPLQVCRLRDEICSRERLLVGVFGRLAAWKGQHVLLEAAAILPGVEVMIVGEAFFGEDAYQQRLVARAAEADLAGRVHFLGFRKDIPELMLAADVIVHTSIAPEPFGRVIIEGMLARKPVIATRAGGALELIEDERSGLLTTPSSSAELTAALRRLQQQPALAASLAVAGRERAEKHFSLSAMVAGIQATLASVSPV